MYTYGFYIEIQTVLHFDYAENAEIHKPNTWELIGLESRERDDEGELVYSVCVRLFVY